MDDDFFHEISSDVGSDDFKNGVLRLFNQLSRLKRPNFPLEFQLVKLKNDGEIKLKYSYKGKKYQHNFENDSRQINGGLELTLYLCNKLLFQDGSEYQFVIIEGPSLSKWQKVEKRLAMLPKDRIPALNEKGAIRGVHLVLDTKPTSIKTILPQKHGTFLLEEVVPPERTFISDSECVDEAKDYEELIKDLVKITENTICFEAISCVETEKGRELLLTVNQKKFKTILEGDTDYVDVSPLLSCLNKVAAYYKLERRFYEFSDPGWGQEFGVVFATRTEASKIKKAGFTRDDETD